MSQLFVYLIDKCIIDVLYRLSVLLMSQLFI